MSKTATIPDVETDDVEPREFLRQLEAQADEWPDDELHLVTLDPGTPTVEGTPRGIRWLYDYMEWAEDASCSGDRDE